MPALATPPIRLRRTPGRRPGPTAKATTAGAAAKAAAAFATTKCGGCIALCCRYLAVEVDRPTEPSDFDTLRWLMLHDRTQVFVEGRRWFVQIFNPCTALGPDQRCTIYDHRPEICRQYDSDWCEKDELEQGKSDDLTFRTLPELEAYRLRWVRRYEAGRRRRRRDAAKRAARTRARRARQKRR